MARHFSDLIDKSRVLLPIRSTEREAIVEELTRFLAESHGCEDLFDILRKGVWDRECEMTTGIGRGVALPHAELEISIEPMAIVGIAPKGVEFDALDSDPVHVFFLLVCSKESREERLNLLSNLSMVLRDHSVPKRIWTAESQEDVVKIIRLKEGTT